MGSPKKTSRYDSAEDELGGFSQSSNWCNATDIQETDETGLRCTVLPEGKNFSETYSVQAACEQYWATAQAGIHAAGVSLPPSPGWPELRKQHDFESCWALTLPEDARCSCILQLFMFIYNVWPGVQYSSLRVHRHMHNLPQTPWKQTSHSTTSERRCQEILLMTILLATSMFLLKLRQEHGRPSYDHHTKPILFPQTRKWNIFCSDTSRCCFQKWNDNLSPINMSCQIKVYLDRVLTVLYIQTFLTPVHVLYFWDLPWDNTSAELNTSFTAPVREIICILRASHKIFFRQLSWFYSENSACHSLPHLLHNVHCIQHCILNK